MASSTRLWSMTRPFLFLLMTIMSISPAAADMCYFWDTGCVDPLAQTAISFRFPPLFLEPINFYFAYDADARGKGQAPMIKAGYWIGYEAYVDNSVMDVNRTSEIAIRVGNLTGTPSGGNNGCDGVWGSECSMNLKKTFKEYIYELVTSGSSYSDPLRTVVDALRAHPPHIANCPPPFFDVQHFPVDEFVGENADGKTAYIKTTGTSNSPWSIWLIDDMKAVDQAEQVAVGIISRTPQYGSEPPADEDEIGIELVCARAPSTGTSAGGD